jgi:hypothetical protein
MNVIDGLEDPLKSQCECVGRLLKGNMIRTVRKS